MFHCSFMMEYDIHTFLDLLTLLATLLVIYMLWFPLKDSYQAAEDNIQSYYVVSLPHDANALQYSIANLRRITTAAWYATQAHIVNANAGSSLSSSGLHCKAWHSTQARFPGESHNLNHTFGECLLMQHTYYTTTLALVASLHEPRHTDSQANLLTQLSTHFHGLHSSWTLHSIC